MAAPACLMISWNRPYPGMHAEAMTKLNEFRPTIKKWQAEGWFESHDMVGLTPHGAGVHGFILLKGQRAKLDELRRSDDFERLVMTLGVVLNELSVAPGVTEEGFDAIMARRPEVFKK